MLKLNLSRKPSVNQIANFSAKGFFLESPKKISEARFFSD